MPKLSESKYHDNHVTRQGGKRPKIPKSWFARVKMRQIAKVLERFDETVRNFEIREAIREQKRNRKRRPRFKKMREYRRAEEYVTEQLRRRAKRLERDSSGRFLPKAAKS